MDELKKIRSLLNDKNLVDSAVVIVQDLLDGWLDGWMVGWKRNFRVHFGSKWTQDPSFARSSLAPLGNTNFSLKINTNYHDVYLFR